MRVMSLPIFLPPLLFLLFAIPSLCSPDSCTPSVDYDGRLVIHEMPNHDQRHSFIVHVLPISSSGPNSTCSTIDFDMVLATEALLFGQRTFSSRFPEESPLGIMIMDSCGMQDRAIRDTVNLETCSVKFTSHGVNVSPEQVRVYSSMGTNSLNNFMQRALQVFHKPVFALDKHELEIQYPNDFLEDLSQYTNQVVSLVHLLKQMDYMFVGVIYSSTSRAVDMYRAFQHTVEDVNFNICYEPFMAPEDNSVSEMRELLKMVGEDNPSVQVMVLLTDSQSTQALLLAAESLGVLNDFLWITFSSSLHHIHSPSVMPKKALYLMDTRYMDDLNASFFPEAAAYTGLQHNPWLFQYLNCSQWDAWRCRTKLSQFPMQVWLLKSWRLQRLIDTYDLLSLAAHNSIDTNLSIALTMAQLKLSRKRESKGILSDLSVYTMNKELQKIGHIKQILETNGTRISLNLKRALLPAETPQSAYCSGLCSRCSEESVKTTQAANVLQVEFTQTSYSIPPWINQKPDGWAMIMTGLSAGHLLIIVLYEIFCLMKLCANLGTAPTQVQSAALLSQLLLFSLFLVTAGVVTYTLRPTILLCTVQRFVVSCSLCAGYGCLLVKSLMAVGGEQGCLNQTVTLLLVILVQSSVCLQWTLYHQPEPSAELACHWTQMDMLRMYAFPVGVLLVCTVVSMVARDKPTNNHEAVFLLATCVLNVILWTALVCIEYLNDDAWIKEISFPASLLLVAFSTFVAMFFPRSRQKTSIAFHESPKPTVGIPVRCPNTGLSSNYVQQNYSEDILAWCHRSQSPERTGTTSKSSPQSGSTRISPSDHHQLHIRIPERRPVMLLPHPSASQLTLDAAPYAHRPPPPPPPTNLFKGYIIKNTDSQRLTQVIAGSVLSQAENCRVDQAVQKMCDNKCGL